MKEIYLDNNATTRVAPEVVEAMMPYLTDSYGNPSSTYSFGSSIKVKIEEAREKTAALIGAHHDEIIFTSCGTESDNTAIFSAAHSNANKKHLITTAVEHHAVLNCCHELEKQGYNVTYLPVDREGMLNLDELKTSLTDETAICSIMYANNETGVMFPIDTIATILKDKGIMFHTDAVQAVGKVAIDVRNLPVDMLSVSGHKLHAPKGVGFLYVRRGTPFHPYLIGGQQESGRRAGTENVPYIIAMGRACELASSNFKEEADKVQALRDRLEVAIISLCPDSHVNGDTACRLPNTTNISFDYVDGEAILMMLDANGIYASSGSACSSGSGEPSHVLRAMSVPAHSIFGSIRFSLGRYNTNDDIDNVIDTLPGIIKKLRAISPLGAKH